MGGSNAQNAAGAAAGKSQMPHAGKPLPGGSSSKPPPFWTGWGDKLSASTKNFQQSWAKQQKTWKKQGKFQMPVHVEMDFINPAVETFQDGWRQLPPQVRQAAPIVGAALATAVVVRGIERSKLRAEKERNMRLRKRVDELLGENAALHMDVADLKGQTRGPRSPSEKEMARALSEATQAAAAAATAAAHAASACRPRPETPQPA